MMKKAKILLVEDNPGDAALCEEAFEDTDFLNDLCVARDGQEAVDYLTQSGKFHDALRPDMILLDLNLPKKNGLEVLEFIKSNDALKTIPVIMLTSSRRSDDILNAYDTHANCYIVKPLDAHKFMNVVQKTEEFWLSVVCFPEEHRSLPPIM